MLPRRHPASFKVAASHWGFKEKSSGGLQTAAALKSFGLLRDVEGGPGGRSLQLTGVALDILLDDRPDSPEKMALIKRAALLPKIHAKIWSQWGGELPSDAELRYRLLREPYDFNENVVDEFIEEYKDTIAFANLTSSDTISLEEEDKISERDEEPEMSETQHAQQKLLPPPTGNPGVKSAIPVRAYPFDISMPRDVKGELKIVGELRKDDLERLRKVLAGQLAMIEAALED